MTPAPPPRSATWFRLTVAGLVCAAGLFTAGCTAWPLGRSSAISPAEEAAEKDTNTQRIRRQGTGLDPVARDIERSLGYR